MGIDFWLNYDKVLYTHGIFMYEEKYRFAFLDQIELMMSRFHQPYSEIMMMPTEERLRLVRKTHVKAEKDENII